MMLNHRLLQKASWAIGGDLVILPSSIHEVVLIQYDPDIDLDYYRSTVREGNSQVVNPDDVLSYKVFRYDAERDEVTVL